MQREAQIHSGPGKSFGLHRLLAAGGHFHQATSPAHAAPLHKAMIVSACFYDTTPLSMRAPRSLDSVPSVPTSMSRRSQDVAYPEAGANRDSTEPRLKFVLTMECLKSFMCSRALPCNINVDLTATSAWQPNSQLTRNLHRSFAQSATIFSQDEV